MKAKFVLHLHLTGTISTGFYFCLKSQNLNLGKAKVGTPTSRSANQSSRKSSNYPVTKSVSKDFIVSKTRTGNNAFSFTWLTLFSVL